MTQEALKLALDAFEQIFESTPPYRDDGTCVINDKSVELSNKAIAAIKEVLAQPEPVGDDWTPCMKLPVVVYVRKQRLGESHVSTREGITPVKPDDLIMRGVSGEEYPISRAIFEQTYSLNTAPPQPEQEPVADDFFKMIADRNPKPFSSLQRTWVGLEGEEIRNSWEEATKPDRSTMTMITSFARAIEAKLKDKNCVG